ncbi:MAG: ComEA family DNA-binding protein [Pseudomonadota bacterium]
MKTIGKYIILLLCILSPFSFAGAVDINTADAPTLAQEINGVGPGRAEAIVAYREKHGSFGSVEDLALVQGIGAKIVIKNKDKLSVGKRLQK